MIGPDGFFAMNTLLKTERKIVEQGEIVWNLRMVKSCHKRRAREDSDDEKKDHVSEYTERSSIASVHLDEDLKDVDQQRKPKIDKAAAE